ncbi:hypothetical protein GZH46_00851, partial [Fragariocoptes setiger]
TTTTVAPPPAPVTPSSAIVTQSSSAVARAAAQLQAPPPPPPPPPTRSSSSSSSLLLSCCHDCQIGAMNDNKNGNLNYQANVKENEATAKCGNSSTPCSLDYRSTTTMLAQHSLSNSPSGNHHIRRTPLPQLYSPKRTHLSTFGSPVAPPQLPQSASPLLSLRSPVATTSATLSVSGQSVAAGTLPPPPPAAPKIVLPQSMGFVDELKQLAQRCDTNSDNLATSLLKKTRQRSANNKPTSKQQLTNVKPAVGGIDNDDGKRRQHDLLHGCITK